MVDVGGFVDILLARVAAKTGRREELIDVCDSVDVALAQVAVKAGRREHLAVVATL